MTHDDSLNVTKRQNEQLECTDSHSCFTDRNTDVNKGTKQTDKTHTHTDWHKHTHTYTHSHTTLTESGRIWTFSGETPSVLYSDFSNIPEKSVHSTKGLHLGRKI